MVQCSAGAGSGVHPGVQADPPQGDRVEESRAETQSKPDRLRTERGTQEGVRRGVMATAGPRFTGHREAGTEVQ